MVMQMVGIDLQRISLGADGRETARTQSKAFFDVSKDPVYDRAVPTADGWLFVSFEGVALRGDLTLRTVDGPLPDHHDRHPSARWHPVKGVWYCDVCGQGGGLVDALKASRQTLVLVSHDRYFLDAVVSRIAPELARAHTVVAADRPSSS